MNEDVSLLLLFFFFFVLLSFLKGEDRIVGNISFKKITQNFGYVMVMEFIFQS